MSESAFASSAEPERGTSHGLHDLLLNRLGSAICGHQLPAGSTVTLDELERLHGVSRTVVRETVRVLEALGLLASRRRVGVTVLPSSEWNVFDPNVIRWRLETPERIAQLRSLTELRMAVEPEAAKLAATRGRLSDAGELMGLAGKLWAAGEADDRESFLAVDVAFHRLVLSSSGNEMFRKLDAPISEALIGRTVYGMTPRHPHARALQLHVDVASAIQRRDPDQARASMVEMLQRTIQIDSVWDQPSDGTSSGPTVALAALDDEHQGAVEGLRPSGP